VNKRRIQPKGAVEHETVSLRLPVPLVPAVDQCAKYLGGSTDRTHVITQAIEIALEHDKASRRPLGQAGRAGVRAHPHHRVAAVPTHLQRNVTAGGTRSVPPASSRTTAVSKLALATSLGGLFTFPRQ
jgi:hypothetical protein